MEGLTQGSLLGDSSCLEMPSKINLQAVPEVVWHLRTVRGRVLGHINLVVTGFAA